MNTDLKHGSITDQILRVFYDVYNELGHGFLEVSLSPVPGASARVFGANGL